jgi:hypothetical protein
MGRLLDSYDRLQAMPFGEWTRRNSDPGLRQMNSQRSTLTSALRKGIRNARNAGDAEAVLKYQGIGNSMGLQTSGIGSYDQRKEGDYKFEQDIRAREAVNRGLTERAAAGVDKVGGMDQADAPRRTVNPNATPVGGGDAFVSRATSPETRSALSGAFGSIAQRRAQSRLASEALAEGSTGIPGMASIADAVGEAKTVQAKALADKYLDDEEGGFIGPEERKQYLAKAKALGAKNDSSFLNFVERRSKTRKPFEPIA